MSELLSILRRKWMKVLLQPIHVYCLHHVCQVLDPESMNESDWLPIDEFKRRIDAMRKDGVVFISLTEAYRHICTDRLRCRKYAVLTFDDGYASLKDILPWLEEQGIPTTLFINGKYLDGKSYRKCPKEKYLKQDELYAIASPLIEIGSHGWEHVRATKLTKEEFKQSIDLNDAILSKHPRYVPFYAYTYGDRNAASDTILYNNSLTPILIDGKTNYNEKQVIHRELL